MPTLDEMTTALIERMTTVTADTAPAPDDAPAGAPAVLAEVFHGFARALAGARAAIGTAEGLALVGGAAAALAETANEILCAAEISALAEALAEADN